MKAPLLILAAFEPELAPIRELIGIHSDIRMESVGTGVIDAAVNTSRLLSETSSPGLRVLFVGSVGAYDMAVPLLSFVTAEKVIFTDYANSAMRAFLPPIVPIVSIANTVLREKVEQTTQSKREFVYTTPSITSNLDAADILRHSTGAGYESLELFAVARACDTFSTPWASLSAVTNHIGPEGHQEWERNFAKAAKLTAEKVAAVLKGLILA